MHDIEDLLKEFINSHEIRKADIAAWMMAFCPSARQIAQQLKEEEAMQTKKQFIDKQGSKRSVHRSIA